MLEITDDLKQQKQSERSQRLQNAKEKVEKGRQEAQNANSASGKADALQTQTEGLEERIEVLEEVLSDRL